jgi:pimeloyl-ACP methyl ester carboxylesterase
MPYPFQIKLDESRVVRGDLYPSRQVAQATLLICHGFKGFKDWGMFPYVADQLAEKLDVVTFNFSHNGIGESFTEFTELEKFSRQTYSTDLEDLHALIEHIRQQQLPLHCCSTPLFLLGHSRGAGVSLIYAFDHPETIQGVISWNGITNVDLLSEEMKAEMRQTGKTYIVNARTKQKMPLDRVILDDLLQNADRFDIIGRAKTSTVPVLLVQGTKDYDRLLSGSQDLVDANPTVQWEKIEGGNHTFQTLHPFQGPTSELSKALEVTRAFIDQQINGSE